MSQLPPENQENPFASPTQSSPATFGAAHEDHMDDAIRKKLSGARWALIIIGVITIGFNAFLFMNAEQEVNQVMRDANAAGLEKNSFIQVLRLIYGAQAAMGALFIGLGIFVMRFPLFCTLTGLVLYVGSAVITGLIDPTAILRGIIIKVIIVVVLGGAVKAALEHRQSRV